MSSFITTYRQLLSHTCAAKSAFWMTASVRRWYEPVLTSGHSRTIKWPPVPWSIPNIMMALSVLFPERNCPCVKERERGWVASGIWGGAMFQGRDACGKGGAYSLWNGSEARRVLRPRCLFQFIIYLKLCFEVFLHYGHATLQLQNKANENCVKQYQSEWLTTMVRHGDLKRFTIWVLSGVITADVWAPATLCMCTCWWMKP